MYTIFMNSENSKTSDPHRLWLNLSDKLYKDKVINMFLYQTFIKHFLYMENYKKVLQK